MLNPIFANKRSFLTYVAIWIGIIIAQFLLIWLSKTDIVIFKFYETLLWNVLFAILGLGLWYVVRFSDPEKNNLLKIIFNHLFAMAFVIVIWLSAGFALMRALFHSSYFFSSVSETIQPKIISGIIYYLVVILCFYLLLYYQNFKEKLLLESDLKTQLKEAELSQLKSQIKPHFLFNSLNSISSLTLTNPDKAHDMIIQLSDFLRYTVGNDQKQFVSLKDERNNILRYLAIEKIRFGNRLNFHWTGKNDILECLLPNMVLQPLVENAIKHGVYQSIEGITVGISAEIENDFLVLKIINNFDSDSINTKGQGLGLQNIRNRLQLLYERKDLLIIESENSLFKVTIKIPCKYDSR